MPRDGTQTRERILEAAERLVLDNGFGATSIDRVIEAAHTSKGAFFHHFDSKNQLADALVDRIAAADHRQLDAALQASAHATDPVERLLGFLRWFEDRAGDLGQDDGDCLYIAVLTERQLIDDGTADQIVTVIESWRSAIAHLVGAAFAARGRKFGPGATALADHVFVTFEGAYLLCRATGDPTHLRRQLGTLRELLAAALG